jgi:hypothetical protein
MMVGMSTLEYDVVVVGAGNGSQLLRPPAQLSP